MKAGDFLSSVCPSLVLELDGRRPNSAWIAALRPWWGCSRPSAAAGGKDGGHA